MADVEMVRSLQAFALRAGNPEDIEQSKMLLVMRAGAATSDRASYNKPTTDIGAADA
jgi:hypothetical protein